jgi:hypothetical protein
MTYIRVSQWLIRIVILAAFVGIVAMILYPDIGVAARISGIGVALQIAGAALAIPELARRLSNKPATDLIIWADTFMPLWKILSKIHLVNNLGQLSVVLSITGVILIFAGLGLQHISSYYF